MLATKLLNQYIYSTGLNAMKQFALVMLSSAILTACAVANATSDNTLENDAPNIYVFNDCKRLDTIAMTESQLTAYHAMKADEVKLKTLEKPMKSMERELEKHEHALDSLSGDMVIEDGDTVVVNKQLIKQHEQIAEKMEAIVRSHSKDIEALELHARQFERTARDFEAVIQPSISKYGESNIQISIGNKAPNWQCEV